MQEAEGITLVRDAIRAGIFNDLGSGGNVDICVITKAGHRMMRGFEAQNDGAVLRARHTRPASRVIPRGATVVLKTTFVPAGGPAAAAAVAAGAGAAAGDSKMDTE